MQREEAGSVLGTWEKQEMCQQKKNRKYGQFKEERSVSGIEEKQKVCPPQGRTKISFCTVEGQKVCSA